MGKPVERPHKQSALREFEAVPDLEFREQHTLAADETENGTNLAWLQLLWDHRRLLRKVAVRALLLSTIVAFLIPRKFESSVSIMPPDSLNGSSVGMLAAMAAKASPQLAAMAGNLLGTKSTGALFADLLHSRTVQDHIVERFHLQKVYWAKYQEDARKQLDKRTSIAEDRKSGVITLELTDSSPERARDMAQAYVEELNNLLAQVSTSSARRERIFIEQRLTAVKADLEDAEKQFSVFASKNTALDIKEQTKAMVTSAAELQGQLIAAQSQLRGLEQIYTENNVRVRSLHAQVGELERQLQKIGGTDAPLTNDDKQQAELYPSIRKLPLLGVEWADLYRRAKIQETVYELLNQQYELARIQEAKEIPTVNVIDPANYPEKKSFPPRLLIIVLLTTMSVVGAATLLLLSEEWNRLSASDPRRIMAQGIGGVLAARLKRIAKWRVIARFRKTRPLDPLQDN
jgi:capsule polysaccharide export protein KpsE/RkpR